MQATFIREPLSDADQRVNFTIEKAHRVTDYPHPSPRDSPDHRVYPTRLTSGYSRTRNSAWPVNGHVRPRACDCGAAGSSGTR